MKQYNYKPRTSSQSSGTSGQAAGSPPKEEAKAAGAGIAQQAMGGTGAGATAGAAGRRRVSHISPYKARFVAESNAIIRESILMRYVVVLCRCRQVRWPERCQA